MKQEIFIIAVGVFFCSCSKKNTVPDKDELLTEEKATISSLNKSQNGYKFQEFDVPAAWGDNTSAYGNNNSGKIVGNYVTRNGELHGFIFDNGQFTDVFVPEADRASRGYLNDINDEAISIGGFNYPKRVDHDQVVHAFKRSSDGVITVLPDAAPGALLTEAAGINNSGIIVGFYHDAISARHGFILSNGVSSTYDKPGAARTLLTGINDQGKIVGFYRGIDLVAHGFTLFNGITEDINFPGSTETKLHGINKTGQIVGEYLDDAGVTHGFLFENGKYTKLDFPGSFDTALLGINDDGIIVGSYNGFSRGLIAMPN
jgi:probable HAF family extracellular repeat protein